MKLVTIAEAARILGVDPRTVEGLVDVGRLHADTLDGERRLRYEDVLALLRPVRSASA